MNRNNSFSYEEDETLINFKSQHLILSDLSEKGYKNGLFVKPTKASEFLVVLLQMFFIKILYVPFSFRLLNIELDGLLSMLM